MRHKAKLTYLAAGLLFAACGSTPKEILSPRELASLLADMQIAEAYLSVEGVPGQSRAGFVDNDSVKKVFRQVALRNHNVTQQQFDKSLNWYGHHLDLYDEVCELTQEELRLRKQEYAALARSHAVDATSLWRGPISVRLSGNTGRRHISYELPAQNLKKGDRIIWSFGTTAMTAPASVNMAVDYTDGTTAVMSRVISSEGRQQIPLQLDSARKPVRIYGRLIPEQRNLLLLDSITLTSSPLSRKNYYDIHQQTILAN